MKKILFISFILFCFYNSPAQLKSQEIELLGDDAGWYEGSVMLADGTELKGLVKYNDKINVLYFQDGNNSKALTPRSAVGFEFFDEQLQKQRIFYTFEYEDSKSNAKRPLFFEVLKEFKMFAVLIKTDPIEVDQKTRPANSTYNGFSLAPIGGNPNYTTTTLEVSQTETIFLMNPEGGIEPYVKITNKQDGTKSLITKKDTKTKNKMLDEDLLANYVTQSIYDKLVAYALQNDLKFKVKEDLIKILDYYEEIVKLEE